MPRLLFVLALWGALNAGGPSAMAAANDLSVCLDASTILQAGGDVGDKELTAAQNACAHLRQTSQDSKTLARVNAAAETIADEVQRRQASRH
jgi:hypothetical protein